MDIKNRALEGSFWCGLGGDFCHVFFESEIAGHDVARDGGVADVAEVPGLVRIAGDIFFAGEIAKNEVEIGESGVNRGESVGFGQHGVVVADNLAVFHEENVEGEAGVVFGTADGGEILFAVVGTVFFEPIIPNLLLLVEGTIDAVEFDLDALGF